MMSREDLITSIYGDISDTLNNKYTIEEFIALHNPIDGKEPWVGYNESIITPDYKIVPARPSHQHALAMLIVDDYDISNAIQKISSQVPITAHPLMYLIEKYKYISVWYDYIVTYPKALEDPMISNMIESLIRARMLSYDIMNNIVESHEYSTEETLKAKGFR